MEYDGQYQEEKKSKYNSALSQLYRIDGLWQSANVKRRNGNLIGWNNDLDCVWSELAGDTNNDKEDQTFEKYMGLIIKYRNSKNILNIILIKKEIWLRKLQNDQGKGTAYVDPMEDWLEE